MQCITHSRFHSSVQKNGIAVPGQEGTSQAAADSSPVDRLEERPLASSPPQSLPERMRLAPPRDVQIDDACRLADQLQRPMVLCDDVARDGYPNGRWYYVPYASTSFSQFDKQPLVRVGNDDTTRPSPFMSLPVELHRKIVDYTEIKDLGRLSLVNRHFRFVCADLLRSRPWANKFAAYLCATADNRFVKKGGVLCLRPLHPLAKEVLPKVNYLPLHLETNLKRVLRLMPKVNQVIAHSLPCQAGSWRAVAQCLTEESTNIERVDGKDLSIACLIEFVGKASGISSIQMLDVGAVHSEVSHFECTDQSINPLANFLFLGPWLRPGASIFDRYNMFDIREIEVIVMRLPPVPSNTAIHYDWTAFNPSKFRQLSERLRLLLVDESVSAGPSARISNVVADMRTQLDAFARQLRLDIDPINNLLSLMGAIARIGARLIALDAASIEDMLAALEQRLHTPAGRQDLSDLELIVMPKHTSFYSALEPLANGDFTQRAFMGHHSFLLNARSVPQRTIHVPAVLGRIWRLAPNFKFNIAYEHGRADMSAPPPNAEGISTRFVLFTVPQSMAPGVVFNRL